MQILIAIAGLSVLIILHELGHFLAARAVGVGVERFSLFFGPAMLKRTDKRGVEWRLGTIPLGGYVRVAGMRRPDLGHFHQLATHLPADDEAELRRLLVEIERVHSAPEAEAVIEELERLVARQDMPESERQRAAVYLADARERIFPGAWWLALPTRKIAVLLAGPAVNVVLAVVLLMTAFMIGATGEPSTTLQRVEPGTPAAAAGLDAGSRIVAVNGQAVDFDGLIAAIGRSDGARMELTVLEDGTPREVAVTPYKDGGRWLVGFSVASERVYYGPLEALGKTVGTLTGATTATAAMTSDLAHGDTEASDQLVGPIGIVKLSAASLAADWRAFLGVLALLSFSLALLNLLPVPPLDGGQTVIALAEMARRRRLSQQTEAALMLAGFGVVFVLLMVGLGNDLTGTSPY